ILYKTITCKCSIQLLNHELYYTFAKANGDRRMANNYIERNKDQDIFIKEEATSIIEAILSPAMNHNF
ncbi:MAG TPA: hypothetical protein VK645_01115, partial [Chitinophagaceae bacterium]|nr:hypothetical protein [Chitinophagaceae bacterium]